MFFAMTSIPLIYGRISWVWNFTSFRCPLQCFVVTIELLSAIGFSTNIVLIRGACRCFISLSKPCDDCNVHALRLRYNIHIQGLLAWMEKIPHFHRLRKPAVHEHQRTDTYFILARERTKFNGQVVLAGRFKKLPYLVLSVEAARWMIYAYFSDCSSNSNAPSLSQSFLACIYSCSFWEIVIPMRRTATCSKDRCPELKKMTTPTGPRRCASVQKRVKIYAVGPAAECLIDEGRWPFRLQKFALDNGILRSENFCELARANTPTHLVTVFS